jgi:hypothetical protein
MNDKTLKALHGSIAKWEAIVNGTGIDQGTINCPLCRLYHPSHRETPGDGCEGCPIRNATGVDFCDDTPHSDYAECIYNNQNLRALEFAKQELLFLKSLVPAE